MKTSIKLPMLFLGLILAASVWAQEEAQQTAEETTPESAEIVTESEGESQPAETEADSGSDSEPQAADEQSAAVSEPATPQAGAPVPEGAEIFTFQAHPNFPPRTAELVYRPLVDYLNDALPYRFELKLAPDYHRYWLSTRRGENPHLVLEEPHLIAYRMNQYDFTPLVRAAEPITYSLLTSMNNAESNVRDFIGQRISTMPAPSLGYLVLASWFDNPMQQPIIQSNAASWMDAVEIVFSREADAAIVPHNLVSRYVNMANVLTSREFPGVTIAASPEVPADIQEQITSALLALHEDEEHFAALHELDIGQFVEAQPSQYEGLDEWISLVYSIF
ncbi:MAG: PhnD/SsuA/transferrin family substrate-binding protein [Xanthomonadales bacterium]|nr:PhnD/SsuA/transferrin family substrate-binding protein [Xanthomonadales bacterium]